MRWVRSTAVLAATAATLMFVAPAAGAASNAAAQGDVDKALGCVTSLSKAKVGKDGALVGAVPKICLTGVEAVPNLATTPVLSPTVGAAALPRATAVNPCASYLPPTVTITPTNPVRGGTYTAVGMNWPKNAPVFGYSIGYFNNGWLAGPAGVRLVNANSAGQWSFVERIDSRRVDYYILKFQSLVCPSARVQLRVNMAPSVHAPVVQTTTTTAKSKAKAATLVKSTNVSSPGSAVLGAVATKSPGKATIQSPSYRTIRATTPAPSTDGSQALLGGIALAVGMAGWLVLYASRRGMIGRRAP